MKKLLLVAIASAQLLTLGTYANGREVTTLPKATVPDHLLGHGMPPPPNSLKFPGDPLLVERRVRVPRSADILSEERVHLDIPIGQSVREEMSKDPNERDGVYLPSVDGRRVRLKLLKVMHEFPDVVSVYGRVYGDDLSVFSYANVHGNEILQLYQSGYGFYRIYNDVDGSYVVQKVGEELCGNSECLIVE